MSLRRPVAALVASPYTRTVCLRCARKLAQTIQPTRPFHSASRLQQIAAARGYHVDRTFFWANAYRGNKLEELEHIREGSARQLATQGRRNNSTRAADVEATTILTEAQTTVEDLPHRRRKKLKAVTTTEVLADTPLPPDASSILSQSAAAAPAKSWKRAFSIYLALTKPRLAFLVTLTTTASYSIYPVPALLTTAATDAPSLSTLTLLFLTSGTFMCIASANTLNMMFEIAHDAKMSRTRNRPLVRGLISKRAALLFAIAMGAAGTGALWYGVNPTTALLGCGNIALYAFAYTALKRIHPVNTWVGALVGGIPPLMGWCAAASQYSTTTVSETTFASVLAESKELLFTEQAIGGWLIAAILFAWQFPHFFALAYGVRQEYAGAGYKMLTSTNMAMASRVSLRYSAAMFPICVALSYYNVTDPAFVATSSIANAWMLREAIRMWQHTGERGTARALFWASVWQLPIVLVLAMVQKKGLWERIWRGVAGEPELDDEWIDEED